MPPYQGTGKYVHPESPQLAGVDNPFDFGPQTGTITRQGVLHNDGTGKRVTGYDGTGRLLASNSMPEINIRRRPGEPPEGYGTGRLSASGSSIARGTGRLDDKPIVLMPACYASHKALQDVYKRNPRIFQGGGDPEKRICENFFPANFRHSAYTAIQSQRRQTLLPEVEYLHRSKQSDGFLRTEISREWNINRTMIDAGATLAVIHKG